VGIRWLGRLVREPRARGACQVCGFYETDENSGGPGVSK